MKKVFILTLAAILFSGCSCLLSQIPPQYIYAGAGCEAILPDYRTMITATDNCEIVSFVQTPLPGYVLDAANKITNVTVKATDASGNFRQLVFSVALVDTIKPVLTVDSVLFSMKLEQAKELYNVADKIIAFQMDEMDRRIADTTLFPESLYPNLRNVYEDSTYYKKTMLTWTAPGYAFTGKGHRVFTWYDADKDTIVIRR